MFTDDLSDLPDSELKRALSPSLMVNQPSAGMMSTKEGVHLTSDGLQEFRQHIIDRGISSGATELPEHALLISPGMLNSEIMQKIFGVSKDEALDLMNKKVLKTSLHEIGHSVSEKAGLGGGEGAQLRQKISSLYKEAKNAKDSGDLGALARLKGQIDTTAAELMRANAMEEARAESFSYQMLPKTELGRKMLEETKSAEFKDRVKGPAVSAGTRQSTFAATKYYHLTGEERFSTPFSGYYGTAGLTEGGDYQTIFGDDAVKQARTTVDVVGSGTILRSIRFWGI